MSELPFRLIPSNTLFDGSPCYVTAQVEKTLNCLGISSQNLSPFHSKPKRVRLCAPLRRALNFNKTRAKLCQRCISRSVFENLFFRWS